MKALTESKTNTFLGEMEYQYIETGYEDKDYEKVFDLEKRIIPVTLSLSDENDLNILKFHFKTPDDLTEDDVVLNLDDMSSQNGEYLDFKAVINDYNNRNNIIEFNGNFVFEYKKEDGFHIFNMRLIFEQNKLLETLIESSFFINKTN